MIEAVLAGRRRIPVSAAAPPRRQLAVLTCMDARIDVLALLGLEPGDAHVIRNAGGRATEDAVRSLSISQAILGTREVMVIHHTGCGMLAAHDSAVAARLEEATGHAPDFEVGSFADEEEGVREDVRLLRQNRHLPHRDRIRGFLYDLASGDLQEIAQPGG